MSERKEIGKIKSVTLGYGGYQEAMLGFTFTLGSKKGSWGVGDFKGMWTTTSKGAKWTEDDRTLEFGKAMRFVWELMKDANVQTLDDLNGVPIEVTFDANMLKSWRILKEVI